MRKTGKSNRSRAIVLILFIGYCILSTVSIHAGPDFTPSTDFCISTENENGSIHALVIDHGYHTGIALPYRKNEFVERIVPESIREFLGSTGASHFEVSWGDRDFFTAHEFEITTGLVALLWPTDSVYHIVSLVRPPEEAFSYAPHVRLSLTEEQYRELVRYIFLETKTDEHSYGDFGVGRYGNSRFYTSNKTYHLFFTCNHWTATALHRMGLSVGRFTAFFSSGLLQRIRHEMNCVEHR